MSKLNKSIGKVRYPDKTSINLLMRDNSVRDPKFQIILFVIFAVVLALFVKFLVVDKLAEAYDAEKAYTQMQTQIDQLRASNEKYDQVREEYSHYGNGYLNDEEKIEQNRMAMMRAIQRNVISKSEIQSVEISGNVATLTIDNIRLKTVSDIVASLEDDDIVSFVTVSTAGTNTDSNALVTATVIINFVPKGGEQ
ncbi:MAG: hypothetical protein ACLRJC_12615 [Emergencia timonensis]|uniref:hypothetical protein n=1 Tax=Emergencia timonensis TaxID=1776384 RepID=UPI000830CF32|nr:hypothetical protein [Emergencia timonensis]WNX90258.1 hypothetical protein RVY71_08250 [Emergencia timonensis]